LTQIAYTTALILLLAISLKHLDPEYQKAHAANRDLFAAMPFRHSKTVGWAEEAREYEMLRLALSCYPLRSKQM